uniref:PH domain-containing protein n=2 Tax=Parascaris univalens TaxID=6257 RepID=A0A915A681_PARUN
NYAHIVEYLYSLVSSEANIAMGRGGKHGRGIGAWRWDNRGGRGSSNAYRSGDEQWHCFWEDTGGGPQQRSGFYDGEYYSEGDSHISSFYRQAWSGLTSRVGRSMSIASWQQEVQQRMGIAGDIDIVDQSSAIVAPHVRGIAAEGAIDARSELATNGEGNNNQLSSYSMQENLSTANVTSVGTCLQGGVDPPQTRIHPIVMEQFDINGDLQVENMTNIHEEITETTSHSQQTTSNIDENIGVEAVICDGQSTVPIQPTEAFDGADGRPVAAPRSRHCSAASRRSGLSCHNDVIPSRGNGSMVESDALIGGKEDENANNRFHRGGETQLASLSSSQCEDERHWSFIVGADNDIVDDVIADDQRERTNSVGNASSKRKEAEIRLNVEKLQRNEDLSERISVETANRRSSVCSAGSVENRDAHLANVNPSERDLSRKFVNTDGREHRGRIRTLSLRSVHDEERLRAYPHYTSEDQLAYRGRGNGADASVQQHRPLHTNRAHQENVLPHLKLHDLNNVAQEAVETTNLDRSSSAHSIHENCLERVPGGLSGRMDDEANVSVGAPNMWSGQIIENEDLLNETFMESDADDITVNETGERGRFASLSDVNIARIGGTKGEIANDELVAAEGTRYYTPTSGSARNLLTEDNIVGGSFERTSSALSSKHSCGDYRRSSQRARTMSLGITSESTRDVQPLDSCRRYASDYQLIPAISNIATAVAKRTSSETSGVRQDEDVKLLKQAGTDSKAHGNVAAATEHTACKHGQRYVCTDAFQGWDDREALLHVPTFELADSHQTCITRALSLHSCNKLRVDQPLTACDRCLSEGRLVHEAVSSGLHNGFENRNVYGSTKGTGEDRFASGVESVVKSGTTTMSVNLEHMLHRDPAGSLHSALDNVYGLTKGRSADSTVGGGSSLYRSRAISLTSIGCNDNERAIGMDVVRGKEHLSKLLSARTAMRSTSTCSMGSESVFDKDELDGMQNDHSNIVDPSAGVVGDAGGQALIDMNRKAQVTLLLSTSCGPSAKSSNNQRTHVSVLNLPVACGDRGDYTGNRPHSATEVTLKIDDEGNLLSNTESIGNSGPTHEFIELPVTVSGISSTTSADDAGFVSLTYEEPNSKVSATGTPSKSCDERHVLMKESGTPLLMRGDSFSNTPSSALNRTHYSRAEFEQRKAAIVESRSASVRNDNQRPSRTPSRNSSSDHSTRIRLDHLASLSSISSSTRDPHICYERIRSSKPASHTSECPEYIEVNSDLRGRDDMEHSRATFLDEIAAMRSNFSRGQTRRLASLFENMVASTAGDAGLLNSPPSFRRNKSLPPPKASYEPCQSQGMLEKQSLDGSCPNERFQEGNKRNAKVRSLADRFEVASTNVRHSGPPKSVNIRPAPQEQNHSRCVTAQREVSDSMMATNGSKHRSKSYYVKEMMDGKVNDVSTGLGFRGWATPLAAKDANFCNRSPLRHYDFGVNEAADKTLKDGRLLTPQLADSAKAGGVQGPTSDAVDKGTPGRSDHNLSSVSISTIGEMNDDADYAARIRGIHEAIRSQEGRLSEIVGSVTALGKNNVRKFAKIYVQRELLLYRERRLILSNELKRIEALKSIRKRTPQLSPTVQSTVHVDSVTVELCKDFRRRSIGEKDSYAFLALLKTDDQVHASDAVSLIDSEVGIVRFSNHVHFDALPVDFAVTVDIYAMKIPDVRRGAEPFSARTPHRVNDTNSPYGHSKKSIFNIPLLRSCEFWRCGTVLMNRNKVGVKQLSLDSAEYPLENVIEIKSHCSALPPILAINFGGFLNVMETVVEETSWTRYWAVLHRGTVSFWMHPDEQASDKPAIASLDLTKCISKKITPTAYKNKSLNMFVLDMLLDSALCVIEEKRVVLSADTEEFCVAWIQAINETLGILRA